MKTIMTIAVVSTLSLAGCAGDGGADTQRIRDGAATVRTLGEELRLTRCALVPGAEVEELRDCPAGAEDGQ